MIAERIKSLRSNFLKIFPASKIFFLAQDIKHGLWWFNATRRLRRTGHLPDWQSSDYLDILKGVEKQSAGTKWNKYLIKSVSGSNNNTTAASHRKMAT